MNHLRNTIQIRKEKINSFIVNFFWFENQNNITFINFVSFVGLNAQTAESAAVAAAGLLPPMNIQNLAALAAMTQPSLTAATQQPSAQLTNAAALLCKYFFFLIEHFYFSFC